MFILASIYIHSYETHVNIAADIAQHGMEIIFKAPDTLGTFIRLSQQI